MLLYLSLYLALECHHSIHLLFSDMVRPAEYVNCV